MPGKISKNSDSSFELGKLYCERGDFEAAIKHLKEAAKGFESLKDWASYLKCQNLLLRMYAELEEHEEVTRVKERLQDLVIRENVELTAKTYYSLALCASFKGQSSTALEYLEKSLALALSKDEKEDICYAINGIALVYYSLCKYEEALKEIYNLQVFFQVLDLPELKLSSQIINGHILRKMGKYDQALELFWQCYDMLKVEKNLYMYISLLYAMGVTYLESGERDMARLYLTLAQKAVDPKSMKYLSRKIKAKVDLLGGKVEEKYDLIFKAAAHSVVERKKGKVDFKNQFILLDMLRLFLKNPGEVYSKEALVKNVWKQEYDPGVHDNKIYVTIKRLRKMIEPDYDKPKYIFRAKNGYYLNRNTKVLFEH